MNIRIAPIGEFVETVGTWNPATKPDATFNYVDLSAVDQNEKQIKAAVPVRGIEAPSRARQLISKGDILVSTVRPNLNGVAAVTDGFDGATASTGFCALRPRSEKLSSNYLMHWVRSPQFVELMVREATGASYPAVSDRIIKASRIPLPPLDEQRRIAAILDKADVLRRKRRRALDLLDSLGQSIFWDMFGDPVSNPRGWESPMLGEICERLTVGIVVKPASYYALSGVIAVRSLNIRENAFDLKDVVFVSQQDNSGVLAKSRIFKDDVVIVRTGQPGKAAVVPANLHNSNAIDILIVTPNKSKLNPQYLCDLLNSSAGKAMVLENKRGQIQQHLNVGSLKAAQLPIPPITAQNEYVDRSNRLRIIKRQAHANLEQLTGLFSSLQSRAFSGQL